MAKGIKRAITLLFALALLLCGCGSNDKPPDPGTPELAPGKVKEPSAPAEKEDLPSPETQVQGLTMSRKISCAARTESTAGFMN